MSESASREALEGDVGVNSTFALRLHATALVVFSIALLIAVSSATGDDVFKLPDGQVGVPYSANLDPFSGTPPYQWQIISGALPPGLNFKDGVISGTPDAGDTTLYNFEVGLSDSASPPLFYQHKFSILITPGSDLPEVGSVPTTSEGCQSDLIACENALQAAERAQCGDDRKLAELG